MKAGPGFKWKTIKIRSQTAIIKMERRGGGGEWEGKGSNECRKVSSSVKTFPSANGQQDPKVLQRKERERENLSKYFIYPSDLDRTPRKSVGFNQERKLGPPVKLFISID